MDLDYLNCLRVEEVQRLLISHRDLFQGRNLLEIGSGTGAQLQSFTRVCKRAVGIEVAQSGYSGNRLMEIHEYDGRKIPFNDGFFDIVFSSNVIEHIRDEATIHTEIRRVLRPGGVAVHIVPTLSWRLWTTLVHYPIVAARVGRRILRPGKKVSEARTSPEGGNSGQANGPRTPWQTVLLNALMPPRHGEFGNRWTEFLFYSKRAWRRRFELHGWSVITVEPSGFTYSGHCLLAGKLSMRWRGRLARVIGASSMVFVLAPR